VPKLDGRMYDETLGNGTSGLSMSSSTSHFFPMHFLGLAGMPRRIPDYALQFAEFNEIARSARSASVCSQILFLWITLR